MFVLRLTFMDCDVRSATHFMDYVRSPTHFYGFDVRSATHFHGL